MGCTQCIRRGLQCSLLIASPAASGDLSSLIASPQGSLRNGEPTVELPSQGLCEELADLYFRFIHDTFHSLFHRPTMMQNVSHGTVPPVILYAMISLSARSNSFVLHYSEAVLIIFTGSQTTLSSPDPRNVSEGEYTPKRAHSYWICGISLCRPCKPVYYWALLASSKARQLQKPCITVLLAVLRCYSILPIRQRQPDWIRKSIEEVCRFVPNCGL